MKEDNKLLNILAFITGLIIYIFFTFAIISHNKIAWVILFLVGIVMLVFFWETELGIMRIWAIFMVIYAPIVVFGLLEPIMDAIDEGHEGGLVILILMLLAEMFAIQSGRILMIAVAFIIICLPFGVLIIKAFVKGIRTIILNKIYGPYPNVSSIVKRDKKIYLYRDHHNDIIQVIYRRGHKKKILDSYKVENVFEVHFSLELEDTDWVIIREYDEYSKVAMEKRIKLPAN